MTDIAIAGGGLAGLATALALAGPAHSATGLSVRVIERGDGRPRDDLRASALTAAASASPESTC